ncbi:MAG: N-acetyl sugar amidotransferase [Flavobacteriia bacterium]|nr:N-acetyl sugar amidotransferase [Flavobacteriia bacterium]
MQDNEKRTYQQCTRCIMDTTDPEISFDEKGQCNHCTEYFRLAPLYIYAGEKSDRERDALIAKIKEAGKNSDYDCMVGVSGGVDSTYVAYMAKKFGLRILAFHFDNGWNSELAVKNVENIVKKLDIDYQTWVVDWEEFRDLQISFLKASVANAEIPSDHAFLAATYHLCAKYKIKYFLSGSNFATEGILPNSWGYNAKDVKHLKGIHKLFGKIKFKTYPLLGFNREFYYTYVKKIKMVRLLNYIPYVKEDAMKVIQDELGWVYYGGKHYESVFTRFFQAYYLPHKFGFDKRLAHLSTLICSGQITREQALEEMKKDTYPPDLLAEDKEYVIKKLGMNTEEFETILNAAPKSYKEYPNDEKRLKFIYKVYNKLRGR